MIPEYVMAKGVRHLLQAYSFTRGGDDKFNFSAVYKSVVTGMEIRVVANGDYQTILDTCQDYIKEVVKHANG